MLLDMAASTALIGLIPLIIVVPLLLFWARMFKDMVNNDNLLRFFKPYWVMAFILLNIPAAIFLLLHRVQGSVRRRAPGTSRPPLSNVNRAATRALAPTPHHDIRLAAEIRGKPKRVAQVLRRFFDESARAAPGTA
jgi:hypothetical protein